MRAFLALLVLACLCLPQGVRAQTPQVPNFWDPQERFIKPNLSQRPRLRFLTVTDFPPFSYIDAKKRLAGFHVDLARALCDELSLAAVCQIQGIPLSELAGALRRGEGDAVMAGLAVTAASRADFLHTRPYFRLPARLAVRKDGPLARLGRRDTVARLTDRSVGIADATAHAAYARAHLEGAKLRLFASEGAAVRALTRGEIDAVFSDGLSLAQRLLTGSAAECCRLAGEPFLAPPYFGAGLTIATRGDDPELVQGLNYVLRSLTEKGTFEELYLRYFPVSLY